MANVDAVCRAARPVYTLYEAGPEQLRVEHPDCDHDFPDDMRAKAFALFENLGSSTKAVE